MPAPLPTSTPTPTPAPAPAPATPSFFTYKKTQILASLATSSSPNYTDKSPKGSVDAAIVDLIDLINSFPGYVTTSSCAGRVAVFVEGRKTLLSKVLVQDQDHGQSADVRAGPGGKGAGNRWLYVSHSPVPFVSAAEIAAGSEGGGEGVEGDDDTGTVKQHATFHGLFGLTPQSTLVSVSLSERAAEVHVATEKEEEEVEMEVDIEERYPAAEDVRLVKLEFSPLILHVLCSSLQTAKPLLAAAINAGFRESGVQSLKALEDEEAGVMVAVRTAGLAFETVVGWVDDEGRHALGEMEEQWQNQEQKRMDVKREEKEKAKAKEESECYRSCVSEGVLRMLVGVVNDRFGWNEQRRERLRTLLLAIGGERRNAHDEWEDKAARKERRREEGLRRQKEKEKEKQRKSETTKDEKSNGHTRTREEEENVPNILDDMDLFREAT